MAAVLDLSSDLESFDGLEAVSFRRPGEDATTSLQALRRPLSSRELEASGGKYVATDVRWHLRVAELATALELGSVITDSSGEAWTVLEVERAALASRWRCLARNLAIVGGLHDRITLQKAAHGKDLHGAPVVTWSDFRTGVRARVQPLGGEMQLDQQQRQTRRAFRIYVAEPFSVDESYRVLHDGGVYGILGYERPERIDQLFVINAERE